MSSEETAASAPSDESQARPKGRPVLLIVALVVGVVIGVIYLKLLHVALDVLWTDIPNAINNEAFVGVYTAVMLVVGATAVVALRRSTGVFGHSPLDGLAVRVDPIRSSLISLAAVIISLFSGAVLGPEAGLIAMGTALGMWFAQRSKADESNTEKLIKIGVLGAVIGLVVNMGAGQTVNIVTDLIWAIPVSIVASLVIVAVRLPAYYLRNWGDKRPPHVYRGTIIGALVALVAIIGVAASHVDPRLILGSGEGFIAQVLEVTSVSTLIIIIVTKGIAYSLCLGGGLRGGPIFPAMFIGGAVGAIFVVLGSDAEVTTLAAAGVLAATSTGLKLGWKPMVIGDVLRSLLAKVPGVGPVPDEPNTAVAAPAAA